MQTPVGTPVKWRIYWLVLFAFHASSLNVMSDNSDQKVPVRDDGLSHLQSVVWKTAASIEVAFIVFFGSRVVDVSDPVIAAIFSVCALAGVWLTRKWVKSSITDEYIHGLAGRIKK